MKDTEGEKQHGVNESASFNLKEEDAYESFSERKTNTNVPTLRNNKNTLNSGSRVRPFSERILNGSLKIDKNDIHGVANQMIFEINLLAGKMLILQH